MARFDVYRNFGKHKNSVPCLLDIQSNHLSSLPTRVVVACLVRFDDKPEVRGCRTRFYTT
jgi:CcdB protein